MTPFEDLWKGRFVKSAQFKDKDVTLTLNSLAREELEGDKGKAFKVVAKFSDGRVEMILNRTNGEALRAMFGGDVERWIGKRITFWPAPFFDPFEKKWTTAIRVRGSPDISAPVSYTVKMPKKKAEVFTAIPTPDPRKAKAPGAKPTPPAAVQPPTDSEMIP